MTKFNANFSLFLECQLIYISKQYTGVTGLVLLKLISVGVMFILKIYEYVGLRCFVDIKRNSVKCKYIPYFILYSFRVPYLKR